MLSQTSLSGEKVVHVKSASVVIGLRNRITTTLQEAAAYFNPCWNWTPAHVCTCTCTFVLDRTIQHYAIHFRDEFLRFILFDLIFTNSRILFNFSTKLLSCTLSPKPARMRLEEERELRCLKMNPLVQRKEFNPQPLCLMANTTLGSSHTKSTI